MAFDRHEPKHPWRENFEGLALAIIMALTLKYFVLEAYKIPTGSMQPTLMGVDLPKLQIFDRILVDKLCYLFRNPERWEVVVFKFPLDQSKNYIKRCVGLPGEDVQILGGDVYVRPRGKGDFQVARKPKAVQDGIWKQVYFLPEGEMEGATNSRYWQEASGNWELVENQLIGVGPGKLVYNREIRDAYADGYPKEIRAMIADSQREISQNPVFDLRVSAAVLASPECRSVEGEIDAGGLKLRCAIPGPAGGNEGTVWADGEMLGRFSKRLDPARESRFAFAYYDRAVELEIDGSVVLRHELPARYEPPRGLSLRPVSLEATGSGATFRDLRIERDIYYTNPLRTTPFAVPDGNYFFLGDNTQNSYDGRLWRESIYIVDTRLETDLSSPLIGDGGSTEQNPKRLFFESDESLFEFVDRYGETYRFRESSLLNSRQEDHPFVPREFVVGRAICVFWPMPPFSEIRRWKFIH